VDAHPVGDDVECFARDDAIFIIAAHELVLGKDHRAIVENLAAAGLDCSRTISRLSTHLEKGGSYS